MTARTIFAALIAATFFFSASASAKEADFDGGSDHPAIPRVEGSRIGGYAFAEYDNGRFVIDDEEFDPTTISPEGKRTRIIYIGQETQSSLQIYRNYQKAFSSLGDLEEVYACERKVCADARIGDAAVWSDDNKIPNDFATYLRYSINTHKDPMYFYGTVIKDGIQYHVSVFTATVTHQWVRGAYNRPVAHIEILEVEDFSPALVTLNASEMSSKLEEQGHVAIYGILFDTNSAELQAASATVIAEIAKAFAADPEMQAYVVGHTDNVGELGYNQRLSQQRAASVVASLSRDHGISANRMTPIGVGPVAPEASNLNDDGRALNRRVEIVIR